MTSGSVSAPVAASFSAVPAPSVTFASTPLSPRPATWPSATSVAPQSPPPTPVVDELRRALRAAREEEGSGALRPIGGGRRVMRRAIRGGPRRLCCTT
eukprot:5168493-Pleurochrysis_carterae.AAC.1